MIAMLAVGLLGAFMRKPTMWLLPLTFPVMMAFGGALGVMGIPVPLVETGIAVSAIVLGSIIAFAFKPPLWTALLLVSVFAIFHGHAHGTELPNTGEPFAYSVGFMLATTLLHLAGLAFGLITYQPKGVVLVRVSGGAIALLGLGFLPVFA